MLKHIIMLVLMVGLMTAVGWAQEEGTATDSVVQQTLAAPPTNVQAFDTPNDNGHSITIEWDISADDGQGLNNVVKYLILRSATPDGQFAEIGAATPGATTFKNSGVKDDEDPNYFPRETDFYYTVSAVTADGGAESEVVGPVRGEGQFFDTRNGPVLVGCLLFTIFTIFFIRKAKSGAKLYIRPLAGIDAVDEAIGRATEMGKPILYILGLGSAADIATIASFTILGRVAKKVAEYQTSLIVPCYDPIVMTVAQETVKTGYYDAGRPDAYNEDDVFFLTNQQFAYVGGVNGIMVRQKPATNFYLGKFYAESLIMAETGSSAGAIQISGTDEVTQIPFFVVACDYTLIGEELYAASAYLGGDPTLLGTLKGQDWAKAGVIISIILGIIAAVTGQTWFTELFHVGN
ncbi:MAG: fibronectin type III domain-containing protein [candidate division Zixibacteria bacterium]|nr:fibronectin type III domain-containing protein [candidate division Zixibacteria bacterium]